MSSRPRPGILLTLGGLGYSEQPENNAIAPAETPCCDKLQKQHSMILLECLDKVVGLPDGEMGNFEVGHRHVGTGRYVPQDFSKENGIFKQLATKVVEAIYAALQRMVDAPHIMVGEMLLTANHGNIGQMADENGDVQTAHSTHPVSLIAPA